jgi:SAM-dependent methyltransferase
MYTGFSEVYDELMDNVDYEQWARDYAALLAGCGISRGRVCECACGTGSLTIPLQRLGYTMTGVDLSQDMLWIASQKAREAGVPIPFIRQDMRNLRLHRQMDAVLATCDGVNYLLTEKDLQDFFSRAYDTLVPGGGLFFDVSTPWKLEHTLGNQTLGEDTERVTYMWQNRWHSRSRLLDLQLSIFVREADGRYRRMDEAQKQRAWTMEELHTALKQAGYTDIAFFGNSRLAAPKPAEERWHIAARRQEEIRQV